jgi:DNA-dependent RNA polymerase auxiliary subunit epsilon
MVKYEPADPSVQKMVERVINGFPQKFIHVNINDLHLTFKDAPNSPWKARTRILGGFYSSLTPKKIGIEVWKQEWINADEDQRALILYHELLHVSYDTEKNTYKLKQHDVQTFYEMLKDFGLDYERSSEVFEILKKVV